MPRAKCPTCRRAIEWSPANPWRPFCSERCKLIDLGAWLTERHAIPGERVEDSDGADADAGVRHRERTSTNSLDDRSPHRASDTPRNGPYPDSTRHRP